MNCERGPTANPCGVCESCLALAEGGPGSVDVIELDAASHGGVDDTRDLRDRAFYAPARSTKRVFIIDEAHMVTTAGFNALLKIVEEPPPHLIFVFATTEPEKVLPTIRSRTHHYPFRLLPPKTLRELLVKVVEAEQMTVEHDVYPLVIRASGGSPRDALSILDQLMSGAENATVTYSSAVGLLGVTNTSLIDGAVSALAAGDGAALFTVVDQCVNAGGDPRRFAVDLLDRLRDLIVVQSVPNALEQGLVDAPVDAWPQRREQAEGFGQATLARCAQTLHTGITEMRGATSPRLLLEVVCARMLLPLEDSAALVARLERLERGGGAPAPAAAPAARPSSEPSAPPRSESPEPVARDAPREPGPAQRRPEPPPLPPEPEREPEREAPRPVAEKPGPAPAPSRQPAAPAGSLHEIWAKALGQIRERSRVAYALLEGAPAPELRGDELVIRQASSALATRLSDPKVLDMVSSALHEAAGVRWRVVCERGAAPSAPPPPPAQEPPAFPREQEEAPEPPSAQARRAFAQRRSEPAAPEPEPEAESSPQQQDRPAPPQDALALLTTQLGAKPLKS
ncbi:DNA polymerase III, subunit gamma and tau [Segniliparus rugosus ATCC BAA-974]|uniref:DNA polymerase III subunit gamma/tau n=1 Tax=Segniliparus rugosus (strain ATCC BAA-974 / DSM 45345 / CCUG 50838 / CIP 108380 / JCM 13579 / CDC 945) TaxID=679197 RepID=U1LMI2_SEGRC|nr:DNA polymerase III, subunit gamma and tau [Segniliparus rugosus ATCC BAA-974]